MSQLATQLKQALRSLLKAPAFSATTVVVLALGIGLATAMFSVLHTALLQPLPYPEPDRLVSCSSVFMGRSSPVVSAPDYYDYREEITSFQGLAAQLYGPQRAVLQGSEQAEAAQLLPVSDNYFGTFGIRPVAGRWFRPDEGVPAGAAVAVVGEDLAQRRFGSPAAAVGRTLTVDNQVRTIVGVVPAAFRFLQEVDLWVPMRRGEAEAALPRNFHNWMLVGRLKPGATLQTAQAEADTIARRLEAAYPAQDGGYSLKVDSLQERLVRNQRPRLLLLMGSVALLLVIACSNVAGLLFVRSTARIPDYALRAALGASRWQLIGHVLAESLLLSLAGGLLGCLLAQWLKGLIPLAAELGELGVPAPALSLPVLLFALATSLLSGVLFGLIPALRISRLSLNAHLAAITHATQSRKGVRTRNALVVAQVALALVLLVLTGLLSRSLARLMTTQPGFQAQGLLTTEVRPTGPAYLSKPSRIHFFHELKETLAALPGVTSAAVTAQLPILDGGGTFSAWTFNGPRPGPNESGSFHLRVQMPGTFATLGIPLLAGRDLSDQDRPDTTRVMVLGRHTAQLLFPGQDPLGQTVLADLGDPNPGVFQVVGVVGDVRVEGLESGRDLAMYVPFDQYTRRAMRVALRTTLPVRDMTAAVRAAVARLDPGIPVDGLVTMASIVQTSIAPQQEAAVTMGLFSAAALLLSTLGLFSVLSFMVGQRNREIGVRLALGAPPSLVLRQVLGDSLVLTALGIALGYLVSLAVGRTLASQLYEVRPADPLVLILAASVVAAISLAAALLPAWRASRVNPVEVLRAP